MHAGAESVREYEQHTTGSQDFYKHWLGIVYTDGIKLLADSCGAHWLVDAIASHQPRIRARLRKIGSRDFQVWRLRRMESGAWALECWSDTPGESIRLAYQRIAYSDFPVELSPFECWLVDCTLMIKSEY